jgi:general secretion pathway protein K
MTMHTPHDTARRAAPDGFILVAVLWIIVALATLASIFSIYLANTAVSLSLNDNSIQTEALVSASLELTAYQLSVPKSAPAPTVAPATPPTRGDFNFRLGRANVAVSYTSETARIDLNAAPAQLLANFFTVLGVQRQNAEQYAERIEGWRTKPKTASAVAASDDNEDSLYRAAGHNYLPRRAPFAHVDELSLVIDLPPELVERARPYLTVYSGKPQINVLDAAPEVLSAVPGVTPSLLNALTNARGTAADPQSISGMLGPLQQVATVEGSNAYRVQVHIRFDNGRQGASEVVILTGLEDKPYRVLSWRDGVDASSNPLQSGTRPR